MRYLPASVEHDSLEDLFVPVATGAKPVLKWVGGKKQLLPEIQKRLPSFVLNRSPFHYVEPFVGGGSVFFFLANHYPLKSALLQDTNPDLVLLYTTIRDSVYELIQVLSHIQSEYYAFSPTDRATYYYNIREQYNIQIIILTKIELI